jgi:hypothetical protein
MIVKNTIVLDVKPKTCHVAMTMVTTTILILIMIKEVDESMTLDIYVVTTGWGSH